MTTPYNFQRKGVRKIEHFDGRCLLADEMGLGKTFQALLWLKRHPKVRPALVECPANIKWVWEAEALKHINMRTTILQGTTPPRRRLTKHHPILIFNYEILQFWIEYLKAIDPQALFIDECHYIKNRSAIRTKKTIELAKPIPHVVAISGTPLLQRPVELFSALNLVRPDIFPSFTLFAFRYCKPKLQHGRYTYKGAANLNELHRKLKKTMLIRRLKKDVIDELPDKVRQVIPIEITKRKEYKEAVRNFLGWLGKKSKVKAIKAEKAQQLVKMGYLKRLAAQRKMKAVIEWIDSFLEENDGKLVLYCCHKKVIERLRKRYGKMSVVIEGSTPTHKRKLAVRNFQKRKKIRLFIGNIRAAGVGITLTAASSLAFVELDWVPGNHTQAEDRIHRIGQKNAANIYYLVAKGTIEELLCEIIQKKQKVVSAVLDGAEAITELEVFDILVKKLKGEIRVRKIKRQSK